MSENIKRSFILGDEWIYYKIYTGIKTADLILTNHLKPLLDSFMGSMDVDTWFFIRYSDPDFHLRLRLHITNPDKLITIINSLNAELKRLMELELIWKIQTDTYQRELERYGALIIENSENIFFHDSKMIISSIAVFEESGNQNLKWLFGLLAIDSFMNAFGFTLNKKKEIIGNLCLVFGEEMGLDKGLRKQLSAKYQTHKVEIFNFFNLPSNLDAERNFLIMLIKEKKNAIKADVKNIKMQQQLLNIDSIISSHIHMTMNRLFRTRNRQAEFVSYQMLNFYYESMAARMKYDMTLNALEEV